MANQGTTQSATINDLKIDLSRIAIIRTESPPADLSGSPTDGIEYYYCGNGNHSLWAVQWDEEPLKKITLDPIKLGSYKEVAVATLCEKCRVSEGRALAEGDGAMALCAQSGSKRAPRSRLDTASEDFVDIPLTPPRKTPEEASWEVVGDDDANEDWAIINHFGTPALNHRDAHVDTPTVRP